MTTEQNYVGKDSHATRTKRAVISITIPALLLAVNPELVETIEMIQDEHVELYPDIVIGAINTAYRLGQASATAPTPIHVSALLAHELSCPLALNNLRQDVRAWFTAYIPQWEQKPYAPNGLEASIENYDKLDGLLSELIQTAIIQLQKGGQDHA